MRFPWITPLSIFLLTIGIVHSTSGNAIPVTESDQENLLDSNATLAGKHHNTPKSKPNIIFFILDDMGWNDAGWINKDIHTPTITKLAKEGIILNNVYFQSLCSPSRAALLTGIYPYRSGMQADVLEATMPVGLPLKYPTMADKLRQQGYATHAIGKWNQGFCHWNYTPTYRGFDTFFGFYQAAQHYYSHESYIFNIAPQGRSGYDFRNNTRVAWEYDQVHSSIPFVKQAHQIIRNHDQRKPLFLYFATAYPHAPHEVPRQFESIYKNSSVKNFYRRGFMARMSAVDHDIEQVIKGLKDRGLYNNSVIIFTADNGGSPYSGGNNHPLRGGKATLYEGGTRVASFINSPLLRRKGFVYDGFMQAEDWLPTVMKIARGKLDIETDGFDMWDAITNNVTSPRKEIIYNIVERNGNFSAAIRVSEWKLIVGPAGIPAKWYKPEDTDGVFVDSYFEYERIEQDPTNNSTVQLYNLRSDPNERHDVSAQNPSIVRQLRARIEQLRTRGVLPFNPVLNTSGDPVNFGGAWTPGWCNAIIAPEPLPTARS